jgi:hypothetical protein
MKRFQLTSSTLGKYFVLPAFAFFTLTFSSCKKDEKFSATPSAVSTESANKSQKLRTSVSTALTSFVNKRNHKDFSDPAYNYSTYSTPTANVYVWSDPTTGTSFTLSESTGGGGGLGQLAYNNKSFDYNYVLTIKAHSTDPNWSGFLSGRDLIGAVAIATDGAITDPGFTLKNFAIFLVATAGGSGTYKFNDFSSTSISNTFAVGEIIDLSGVQGGAGLANFANDGKVYYTTDGHIIVSSSDLTMDSDAKVMDVVTSNKYAISGSLMLE